MADATLVSKSHLLAGLREGERLVADKLAALPASEFDKGCYENGWNARQVLAHIAAIEWSYGRLIDVARAASEPEAPKAPSGDPPQKQARGGIDDYNARQIERYSDASVSELLGVFKENRAKTIAAVESTDDALFSVPVKSAGGIPGPLGTVLNYVAVMHVQTHVNDILQAAGR